MLESVPKEIGSRGFTYHIKPLGARSAGRLFVRVSRLAAGAVEGVMQELSVGGADVSLSAVGKMFSGLAREVSEDDFDHLCDIFSPCTTVSGGELPARLPLKAMFDTHFVGALPDMFLWLGACLEVNYGGFLPVAQEMVALAKVPDPQGSVRAE